MRRPALLPLCASLLVAAARPTPAHAALEARDAADGALELWEGGRRLARVALETPGPGRRPATVREARVRGRRVVEVRAALAAEGRAEVWIGELAEAGPKIVWRGLVGALDADGETSQDVRLIGEEVVSYQTAGRLSRCDRAPVRLFARRYDFEAGAFRDLPAPVPPPAAARLEVRRGRGAAPPGPPVVDIAFTAASSQEGAADVRALTAPAAVNDGLPTSVWRSGTPGDGAGEWLTARTGSHQSLIGLTIVPGDTRDPASFRAAARPRALTLLWGAGPDERLDVTLVEDPESQAGAARFREPFWIPFPRPVEAGCLTVLVREVAPGTDRQRPMAIADLQVFTTLDREGGAAQAVAALVESAACEPRVAPVAALGARAIEPLLAALEGAAPGPHRPCLLEALVGASKAGLPRAAEPAVAQAVLRTLPSASAEEERWLAPLLGRLADPPVAALVAALGDSAAGGTVGGAAGRAARLLAGLDRAEARAGLLAGLGGGRADGRRELRRVIAGAEGRWAPALLGALAETPDTAVARRADLLAVLGARAPRESDVGQVQEEVRRSLVAGVAPDQAFEVRARAVEALGRLRDEPAVETLAGLRAADEDAVIRALALRELAEIPGDRTLAALRAAVDDDDPRVRETAALALGRRGDRASSPLLVAAAKQEPWPQVRRAEIVALGRLCTAEGNDLLVRANERDVPPVRRAALVGLAGCRDPRAAGVLLAVLGRAPEAPELRLAAAALLADLREPSTAPALAEALRRVTVESQADLALEPVAATAVRALAAAGGPPAVAGAVALLADPRPPLRRAAAEALGSFCEAPDARRALERARGDEDAAVARAAATALRRCGAPDAPPVSAAPPPR